MMLDVAQSITLLILGLLTIAILVKILFMVHGQSSKVKELEKRMKAFEKIEAEEAAESTEADMTDNEDSNDQDGEEAKK